MLKLRLRLKLAAFAIASSVFKLDKLYEKHFARTSTTFKIVFSMSFAILSFIKTSENT